MDASIEFDNGRGRIWNQGTPRVRSISPELASRFAPAKVALEEWVDYWVRYDEADRLRVGDTWLDSFEHGRFRLRFENQIGLTVLRPYAGLRPLGLPLWIEVLSPKFRSPAEHLSFLSALVTDLLARAVNLPFAVSAKTARAVVEERQPPTPLFTLHFLLQYTPDLRTAWSIVQASPHRRLADRPVDVPLVEVAEADAEVLQDVLKSPDRWVRARGFPLAARLGGHAPASVWQRRPIETLDTPENRFALAFLEAVLTAAEQLPAEDWWSKVSLDRRHAIHEATELLRLAVAHPMFADVGPMHRYPAASRVLMRREGYRQLRELWRHFHQSRRPLFAELQHAFDVRDIATLYETWVYFALVDEISRLLGVSPTVELSISDESGLAWNATARFGTGRELVYNHLLRSYSVPLRPDFLWREDGKPTVALDAKFRVERADFGNEPDDDWRTTAKRADLYKMHTYRDALGVRAALAIYPGDEVVFYDALRDLGGDASLASILLEGRSGIGALPLRPDLAGGELLRGSPV